MKTSKQAIGRISQRIKTQMKSYQKALSSKHWPLLEQVIFSLLKDPSVFISQIARFIGEEMMPIAKRLLRLFHSPKMMWEKLIRAHLKRLKRYVRSIPFDKLLIYADLSDLAKPRAQKMPDLDRVRDGSESTNTKAQIKPGFWLNEIYVQFPGKKIFPAIFYPFSTLEKGFRSVTDLILNHMTLIFQALTGIGLWVSDRGYDNLKFFYISSNTVGSFSSGLSFIKERDAN